MKLNYLFPEGNVISVEIDECSQFWETWLIVQVEQFPEAIFFYTVDTTDIF